MVIAAYKLIPRKQSDSIFRDTKNLTIYIIVLMALGICLYGLEYVIYLMVVLSHALDPQQPFSETVQAFLSDEDFTEKRVIAQIMLMVFTFANFLNWVSAVRANNRVLGAEGLRFGPISAPFMFLLPFVNIVVPYFIMQGIWRASKSPENWHLQKPATAIIIWWMIWWVPFFIMPFYMAVDLIDYGRLEIYLAMLVCLLRIIFIVLSWHLITAINKMQWALWEAQCQREQYPRPHR